MFGFIGLTTGTKDVLCKLSKKKKEKVFNLKCGQVCFTKKKEVCYIGINVYRDVRARGAATLSGAHQ